MSQNRSPARQRKKVRLMLVCCGLLFLGAATAMTLAALEENVTFFFGPSEVADGKVPDGAKFRIGGLVEAGSVSKSDDGVTTLFAVTDGVATVPVAFSDLLPSLFREGQGVVALGRMDQQGTFVAEEVLARHDETYMPAEAVEAMKRAGTWQEGEEGSAEGAGTSGSYSDSYTGSTTQ